MKKNIVCLAAIVTLAACSANHKKIIVYAKGAATIDEAAKTITTKEGAGQDEKTADFNTADKLSLKLISEDTTTTIDIPENGFYIINAKKDTVVGGYVQYTDPKLQKNITTQETLKHDIDSLQQLTEGKNVSAANRNFYLLPHTAVKFTNNIEAEVVGPFHKMTSAEMVDGKAPEVYRFYSVKEIRETIAKLTALTVGNKK